MSRTPSSQEDFRALFLELSALVNTLPSDQRASIRTKLGDYAHDLKHQLGLVMGANALLERNDFSEDIRLEIRELAAVIREAAAQIDGHIDMLTEYLNHQIDSQD